MNNRGFTLIELMIVVAIIAILAVVAEPKPISFFDEHGAIIRIASMKGLQKHFQTVDKEGDGVNDFATDFAEMQSVGLLPASFDGQDGGYTYTMAGSTSTWSMTATPTVQGVTGDRSFFVDETGVIRYADGPGANASSTPLY